MTAPKLGAPIYYAHPDLEADRPARSRAIEWSGFLQLVAAVASAGLPPPPAYTALLDRYGRVQAFAISDQRVMAARLSDAVLSGGDADVEGLFAAALSERFSTGSELQAGLLSEVRDRVQGELGAIVRPNARKNYVTLAGRFDAAATGFTKCAAIIPPDTAPDLVINQKSKVLEAWRDAERYAAQLDELLESLSCASELVRGVDQPSGLGRDRNYYLLPLCCDVEDIHRRLAWHAWIGQPAPRPVGVLTREQLEQKPAEPLHNRCGRWARMIGVGAVIRAHPDPSSLELFDMLKPVGVELVQTAPHKRAYVQVDPEGDISAPRRRGPASMLLDKLAPFRRREPEPEPEPDILATIAGTDDDDSEPRISPQPHRFRGDRGETS